MALLDLGIYTDEGNDRGQSTTLFVPNNGELPELFVPNLRWLELESWFSSHYGLGYHRWVQVGYDTRAYGYSSIGTFFVESRREWVCFLSESYQSPFGYYLGDHTFRGPFQVNEIVMEEVLHVYEVDHRLAATPEIYRCHPDLFRELSAPDINL